MAMEEESYCYSSSEINSVDVNKVLQSNIACLTKKRKLQADQLGMPLPKYTCCSRSLNPKYKSIMKEKDDESGPGSVIDSDSFCDDMDSSTSLSAETKLEYAKMCEWSSTSSDNWGTTSSKDKLYSSDGILLERIGSSVVQLVDIGKDHSFPGNDFGLKKCLNFDDELLLGYGYHEDYTDLDGNEIIEQSSDKEIVSSLYSDGTPSTNCNLASERWIVEQDIRSSTNNLTIDKEFEQYFSMLML